LHRNCVSEQAIAELNNGKIASLLLSTEAVGTVFFVVLLLAYCLGLPSTDNLIGDPSFRVLLQVFGGLFLVLVGLTAASIVLTKKGN
jgi:hypothetical protein